MTKIKYLDSISVKQDQINNLLRIFLNHLYLHFSSADIPFELSFDPEFKIHHIQIREENVYIYIENLVEKLASKIKEEELDTFQVIFQLFLTDSSIKKSLIKNIFYFKTPKKEVLQEFLLHVTINEYDNDQHVQNTKKNNRFIIKSKLAKLLLYIENDKNLSELKHRITPNVYIKGKF